MQTKDREVEEWEQGRAGQGKALAKQGKPLARQGKYDLLLV